MSEFEKESLSALLDGEADQLELRRVLRSSESDSALLQTWGRYNLAQATLHGQAKPVSDEFANRVAAQLESEATYNKGGPMSRLSDWQQGLAKVAIAASVAVVFVVSMNQYSTPSNPLPLASGQQNAEPAAAVMAATTPVAMDPEAEKRLRDYISATAIDDDEPVRLEHIQDSPLYRLVNRLQEKP